MIFVFELVLKEHVLLCGLHKFYDSLSVTQSQGYGPAGCAVWSHRSEAAQIQSPCATASSVHLAPCMSVPL